MGEKGRGGRRPTRSSCSRKRGKARWPRIPSTASSSASARPSTKPSNGHRHYRPSSTCSIRSAAQQQPPARAGILPWLPAPCRVSAVGRPGLMRSLRPGREYSEALPIAGRLLPAKTGTGRPKVSGGIQTSESADQNSVISPTCPPRTALSVAPHSQEHYPWGAPITTTYFPGPAGRRRPAHR